MLLLLVCKGMGNGHCNSKYLIQATLVCPQKKLQTLNLFSKASSQWHLKFHTGKFVESYLHAEAATVVKLKESKAECMKLVRSESIYFKGGNARINIPHFDISPFDSGLN